MSLSNLTFGGWLLFVWCIAITAFFVVRVARRYWPHVIFHTLLMAGLWAWLLYLATP
jgi:hypothetical protein